MLFGFVLCLVTASEAQPAKTFDDIFKKLRMRNMDEEQLEDPKNYTRPWNY
jgi:hypothetical protein